MRLQLQKVAFLICALIHQCHSDTPPSLLFAQTGAGHRVASSSRKPPGPIKSNAWTSGLSLNSSALVSSATLAIPLPYSSANLVAVRGVPGAPAGNQRSALTDDGIEEAGSRSWVGSVAGEPFSIVSIARGANGVVSGSVLLKGATHQIDYQQDGSYAIYQVDDAALPQRHPRPLRAPTNIAPQQRVAHYAIASRTAVDASGVVDLAVFYTNNARLAAGQATLEAKIRAAVVASNAVYQASKLKPRLRLAYMGMVSGYSADKAGHNMGLTLQALADPTDGQMDTVWQIKSRYGLDAITLISADTDYCGLAYVMETVDFAWPFSVVNHLCLPLTLTHELGHAFGMQHDHDQFVAGKPYKPSSFGYRMPGKFSTIMAYGCSAYSNCYGCAECPKVPYFANPALAPMGSSMGRIGKSGYADATATLNDPPVLAMMANWGKRRDPGIPTKPTNIVITAQSGGKFRITWRAGTNDAADGFKIYKRASLLGGTFKLAGVVRDSDRRSWTDPNPTKSLTTYCYQVVAFNYKRSSVTSAKACRLRVLSG